MTFVAFFPFTGSTFRLQHFVEFTDKPFSSKMFCFVIVFSYGLALLQLSVRENHDVIVKIMIVKIMMINGSSAKAMMLINVSPNLTPILFCSIFSINSSITMLNRSGDSGQPCFTPALISICLVSCLQLR